jgi:hypothetical protein
LLNKNRKNGKTSSKNQREKVDPMHRFPKETLFQQQMLFLGSADPEEYPVHLRNEQEEEAERYHLMQRLNRKRFL